MTRSVEIPEDQLRRFWASVALPDENGCMLWLKGLTPGGYARTNVGSQYYQAHRISLTVAEGQPPSPRHQAAHSCRNRHCVAPLHLRWATPEENTADKVRDGVMNRGERCGTSKLTRDQVLEIRRLYREGLLQREIAQMYGLRQSAVSRILNGVRWAWLTEDGSEVA